MYKIIKDGANIGLTEKLNYIMQAENGCYILCPEQNASGIVFEGTPYHLLGRDGMEDLATVSLETTDAGTEITNTIATGGIMFVMMAEAGTIDPVTAGKHAELFAEWAYPVNYKTGQIRRFGEALYKCVQDHTSQEDWTPPEAPSLWSLTADPSEEWPEWIAPIGAHNSYPLGAKVSHNEKHWTSTVENNVWGPGLFGWEEVTNEA